MAKVKTLYRQSTNLPLNVLLIHLNRMLRGRTAYFKYGWSNATFSYLRALPVETGHQVAGTQAPAHSMEGTTPTLVATLAGRPGPTSLVPDGGERPLSPRRRSGGMKL